VDTILIAERLPLLFSFVKLASEAYLLLLLLFCRLPPALWLAGHVLDVSEVVLVLVAYTVELKDL